MMNGHFIDEAEFRLEWFSAYRQIREEFLKKCPFENKLASVFSVVLAKLAYLRKKNQAMHVFVNPAATLGQHGAGVLHFMTLQESQYRVLHMTKARKPFGIPKLDNDMDLLAPSYFGQLPPLDSLPPPNGGQLWEFEPASLKVRTGSIEFVRLSCQWRYQLYNLGIAFLWENSELPTAQGPHVDDDTFLMYVEDLLNLLIHDLVQFWDVQPPTYLPDYRKTGVNTVAILFADIRNFTTITEILRGAGRFSCVTSLVNAYSEGMNRIIDRHGRLDKLMGDGLMALFGEYTEDKAEMCGRALLCAREMVEEFRRCRERWHLDESIGVNLADFRRLHNESLDIEMGVGINIGEVYFGYYGAKGREDYSPIGDHVNFAQRLESHAAQMVDVEAGIRRAPILISQSVRFNSRNREGRSFFTEEFEKTPARHNPRYFQVKGLGNRYPVFLLEPSDIDTVVINNYLKTIGDS